MPDRTPASVSDLETGDIFEIRHLFVDAILAAEELIYLENQYFSSQAVYWSLIARMALPDRARVQIVMVLPDRLPFTEELFLGLPQMKMLHSLTQVAEKTGHGFAVFTTACMDHGERKRTFIHSKLLLVDDRFLSVGSANATNRSMGLDTELNVSWEASEAQAELSSAIRALRPRYWPSTPDSTGRARTKASGRCRVSSPASTAWRMTPTPGFAGMPPSPPRRAANFWRRWSRSPAWWTRKSPSMASTFSRACPIMKPVPSPRGFGS